MHAVMNDKGCEGGVGHFVKSFLRRPTLQLRRRSERTLHREPRLALQHSRNAQSSLHEWEESPVTFLMMPQKSEAS